ncbi:MAG: dihydrofolate reductase [Mariprofundaceae bacterium]|nr:dihydrofolate reductase [Mariprofundaceae bacterium]
MLLSLIAAMDENRLIGAQNRLPWRLPADMQWFKKQTMGKAILMGRATFASIGKALPGRKNIVLSRNSDLHLDGCTVIHDLSELAQAANGEDETMVIGGAQIYNLTLPLANRLYITRIHTAFSGDTYFPEFDAAEWRQTYHQDNTADEANRWPYTFRILERNV